MKIELLKKTALAIAFSAALVSPVLAQDNQADPHAHDWFNEQVKGKIDPTTGEKIPPSTATGTGTAPAQTDPGTNILNQSLGSIDENYRGKHKWFNDDVVGNWFEGIGRGDPLSLGVLGVVIAGVAGIIWFGKSQKPAAKTEEKTSS